jgi:hypothetical protein
MRLAVLARLAAGVLLLIEKVLGGINPLLPVSFQNP